MSELGRGIENDDSGQMQGFEPYNEAKSINPVAGPELDALVAEKVMGCKPIIVEWPTPIGTIYRYPECQCECRPHGKTDESGFTKEHGLKPYSTDIAAAWQVVEKIGECETPVIEQVRILAASGDHWGWAVRFGKLKRGEEHIQAATAPLAICLVALKAVGVEVGE